MSLSKCSIRFVVFFVCVIFLSAAAHPQYRASIQGVVTDPQGAAVSGATLTLKNLDTNQTLTATTDENGIYNFNALPSSQYSVTVEKPGFNKKVLDKVGVIAEQANALNIQLEVGEVTQSITVSGDSTPLIDTQTASVSGTICQPDSEYAFVRPRCLPVDPVDAGSVRRPRPGKRRWRRTASRNTGAWCDRWQLGNFPDGKRSPGSGCRPTV
jgi:hypothetical protein